MARRPGVSISTFYREWRRAREASYSDADKPLVLYDASYPGVIRRNELEATLAREWQQAAAASRALAKSLPRKSYDDLRAQGYSHLRARREAAAGDLSEVAAACGLAPRILMQIEDGTRKATPDQLSRIEAALLAEEASG